MVDVPTFRCADLWISAKGLGMCSLVFPEHYIINPYKDCKGFSAPQKVLRGLQTLKEHTKRNIVFFLPGAVSLPTTSGREPMCGKLGLLLLSFSLGSCLVLVLTSASCFC